MEMLIALKAEARSPTTARTWEMSAACRSKESGHREGGRGAARRVKPSGQERREAAVSANRRIVVRASTSRPLMARGVS